MFPLTITTIQDEKDLKKVIYFMSKQSQNYPHYQDWLYSKCLLRMESGRYKSIFAVSDGMVIGDAIYQFLDEKNIEIKNFRIDPLYQNRDLGHFLLKQVAKECPGTNVHLDVSVDNFEGVEFFIHNGFKIVERANLYAPQQPEYLMQRIQ